MDSIDLWAMKIAEEVAPDEVDLAPTMARAFVRGGKDKKDMFRRSKDAVPGAFGAELGMALFPQILGALQYVQDVGPALSEFFTSTKDAWAGANSFIGALNVLLTIRSRRERKNVEEALPDDPYGSLKSVVALMSKELQSSGLSSDQADLITFRVLRVLLEDPSGAAQFTEEIRKAS
jgi:hypothetical protein